MSPGATDVNSGPPSENGFGNTAYVTVGAQETPVCVTAPALCGEAGEAALNLQQFHGFEHSVGILLLSFFSCLLCLCSQGTPFGSLLRPLLG